MASAAAGNSCDGGVIRCPFHQAMGSATNPPASACNLAGWPQAAGSIAASGFTDALNTPAASIKLAPMTIPILIHLTCHCFTLTTYYHHYHFHNWIGDFLL